MCGICGIVDVSGAPVAEADVVRLRDRLAHRGPDDAGAFVAPGVGLGARRLAILDLSPRGHMPMASDDGQRWLTYNGEVYNYRELRARLQERGHRFRSDSDTEVVLRAYEEWGEACVEQLAGMFAFAVWDARRQRLFAARDRLGVKPLYYRLDGPRLTFASEIHALYDVTRPRAEDVDPLALDGFLAWGYLPADRCLLRGYAKLPPAHTLAFSRDGLELSRYWRVAFRPVLDVSESEALEHVDATLQKAVTRRLRSDVPLGSFLSGGIDSGLVTALAAEASEGQLNTFSVGFTGATEAEDERPLARLVAERYGTNHKELVVDPSDRSDLVRALWHVGEPFADVGILPMFQISREARTQITVALSGDGGDESFAGYPNVRAALRAETMRRRVPRPLLRALRAAATKPPARGLPAVARAARWLDHYVLCDVAEQFEGSNHWTEAWRARLYTDAALRRRGDVRASQVTRQLLEAAEPLPDAEQHLLVDLQLRLPGAYLPKVDIASNMVSLEVRSPLLDHELVSLAARLPFDLKLLHGRQKGLLRRLAERRLPAQVVTAPKRGFAPRLGRWLQAEWAPLVRELLADARTARAGLLRQPAIDAVASAHLEGRADHGQRIWNLVCLEIWWRLFVDRSLAPGDGP